MAKKKAVTTNAMRMLASAKIEFETIEYETDGNIEDNFGMAIAEKTGLAQQMCFKTLVVRGEKNGIMVCCIPVDKEIDLKKFAVCCKDKRVEMIHVKELLGLTGYIRGGVSPIGMKKKYPTYIDASCMNNEKIAVSGGVCGITLVLATDDLLAAVCAETADITKE